MATAVENPFPIFFDNNGKTLESGYIYIGEAGLNPEVFPIEVFWDKESLYPAAQPIRTINGLPSKSGTPSAIFISNSSYSIKVEDKNNNLIFSALQQTNIQVSPYMATVIDDVDSPTALETLNAVHYVENIAALKVYPVNAKFITTLGRNSSGDNGGLPFYWDDASTDTENGGTIIQKTGVSVGRYKSQVNTPLNLKAFGALPGNTMAQNVTVLQAAADFLGTLGTDAAGNKYGGTIIVPDDIPIYSHADTSPTIPLSSYNAVDNVHIIIHDRGTVTKIHNGHNSSGIANEAIFKGSGYHQGLILETDNRLDSGTKGAGQIESNRTSIVYRVDGVSEWQIANDVGATKTNNLTFYALSPSKQILHLDSVGLIRYGRLDSIQDFSTPPAPHVFNKNILHQGEDTDVLSHTMRTVSPGVKDDITMTGATKANPCVITTDQAHNLSNGGLITINSVNGMVELNSNDYTVANVTDTTIELSGIDSTAYTTYTSAGAISPQVLHQKTIQLQLNGDLTIDDGTTFIFRLGDGGQLKSTGGIGGGSFTTAGRNALTHLVSADRGVMVYDTTLGYPVFLDSVGPLVWHSAIGAAV